MEGSRSPLNGPVQSFQDLELLIVSGYTVYTRGKAESSSGGYPRAPTRESSNREREREGGRKREREREIEARSTCRSGALP